MRFVNLSVVVLLALVMNSCFLYKEKCSYDICDVIAQPEEINVVEVSEPYREREEDTLKLLSGFPFISYRPVIDFYGKFPPEFYSSIKMKWKAIPFEKADYWKMRWDPYIYDFIYVKPIWIGNFSLKSDDLLRNLAINFNVSDKEIKILKDWLKQGGVLWIESAIFVSSYDMELNKIDMKKLLNFVHKLKECKFFGKNLRVFIFKTTKIDKFHTKTLMKEIEVSKNSTSSEVNKLLNGINKLLLTQEDYAGIYFTVDGTPIVMDGKRTYSSYINYGKGKVITTVPFDFFNVYYDGELYRWNLLLWAMEKK